MKINAVISPYKPKIKKYFFDKNRITLITFLIMLLSVIAGSVIYILNKDVFDSKIADGFSGFVCDFINKSKPEIFSGLLLNNMITIGLIFLFSTSVLGLPFIYILLCLRLIGLSILLSFLYSSYGLHGIEYSFLIIIPGKYLMLLAMMIYADSSVAMSEKIRKSDSDIKTEFANHSIRTIVAFMLSVLGVLIDFVLYILFTDLFSF